jgi:dolichol-phosphate mannosyltransferase
VRLLYRYPLTDEATCYKAFRTDLLRSMNLKCERFEFCPEVTAKSLKRRIPILEVPLENYRPRRKAEGKKIRWTDGVEALWTLIRYRFRD